MVALWNYRWTAVTLLTAGFSLAVAIGAAVDPYPGDTVTQRASVITLFTAGGLVTLTGLWLLRRSERPILASVGVGLGVVPVGTLVWLWVPTIVAVLIVAGGVVAGGLRRELCAPQDDTQAALA